MAAETPGDLHAQLHAALDNMPGALVYTDDQLNIVVCNQRFPRCIRFRPSCSSLAGHTRLPAPPGRKRLLRQRRAGRARRPARGQHSSSHRTQLRGPRPGRSLLPHPSAARGCRRHGHGDDRHHRAQAGRVRPRARRSAAPRRARQHARSARLHRREPAASWSATIASGTCTRHPPSCSSPASHTPTSCATLPTTATTARAIPRCRWRVASRACAIRTATPSRTTLPTAAAIASCGGAVAAVAP